MPEPVAMRSRSADDVAGCVELLRAVHLAAAYPVHWPDDPVGWLTPLGFGGAWVAVAGGRVIGHVSIVESTAASVGDAQLERLFVAPAWQGHGVGQRMVRRCMDEALGRDVALTLAVADNCSGAIRLYRRMGWHETSRGPIDWGAGTASCLVRFAAPTARSD